jgi:hypothetical protein
MKTTKSYLTGSLMIVLLLTTCMSASSQDAKQTKQSKKEAKRAKAVAEFQVLDSLLSSGRYVLEANYLQNKYGSMVSVSSNLNFVSVDGPKGVLQTGTDLRQGYNGVGGVTAEGSIGAYEIRRDPKRLTVSITFQLLTTLGNFDIFMNIAADNIASATISGSTSGKLTWRGRVVSLDKSKVYKGHITY